MNSIRRKNALIAVVIVILAAALLLSCQPALEAPESDHPSTEELLAPVSPETPEPGRQLTPIEELGITGIAQDVDIEQYRLTVRGLVAAPLSLTYEDILAYSPVSEVVVLNCPGYFVDVAEWTGVPLTAILDTAGIEAEATKITFSAVDGYRQVLSREHVQKHGVLLAYKVNGQTLPPEHGYPLRLVDPGSDGSAWIKWLENIEVG